MRLSKNLSLKEVTRSGTAKRLGIPNAPTKEHLKNLKKIAEKVFQPLRDWADCKIFVSSGYRSEELNRNIKGSAKKSDHLKGCALDLDADFFDAHSRRLGRPLTNRDIFKFLLENQLYTKLIWEFGNKENPDWVHVSYDESDDSSSLLVAFRENGKTKYRLMTNEEIKSIINS
jgi:hypothetical protein